LIFLSIAVWLVGHHGHEFFDFRGDFHGDFHGGRFGGSGKFEKGDLNAALNFFNYGFRQAVGFAEVLGQFSVVPMLAYDSVICAVCAG
jgi:hypothetical protein